MQDIVILDRVRVSDVIKRLKGTDAEKFAYPATLYAAHVRGNHGASTVIKFAVSVARSMARAEG